METEPLIVAPLTDQQLEEFLSRLYAESDRQTNKKFVVVSPALAEKISKYLLSDNKFKARIEEIAGIKYSISSLWVDPTVPQAVLAPIDIAKIVAVYTDFEGEAVTVNDLFSSKIFEWQN